MQEVKITPSWALGTQPWLSWQTCQFAAFCAEKISTPWKNAANAINWGVWRWLQLSRSIFNFCIGFYWVCLGFIDFSPSKYQVLLDSFLFLERVLGYFLFLPFWIIFDFSPYQSVWSGTHLRQSTHAPVSWILDRIMYASEFECCNSIFSYYRSRFITAWTFAK